MMESGARDRGHRHDAADALAKFVRDLADSDMTEPALLGRLADAAMAYMQADGTCVLELDGSNAFQVVSSCGSTVPYQRERIEIQPPPSLFREVISTGVACYTNDPDDQRIDPRFSKTLNIRRAAVAPIVVNGVVTGLLLCINSSKGDFGDAEMAVLSSLADQAALVLRNQRLVNRAHVAANDARRLAEDAARSAHHNAILAGTGRVLADSISGDSVYDNFATLLCAELQADRVAIYDANPQLELLQLEFQSKSEARHRVDARANVDADTEYQRLLHSVVRTASACFVERRLPLTGYDARQDNSVLGRLHESAVAIVPLLLDGQVRGVLSIQFAHARTFDDAEQRLMHGIAIQVALAFRNVSYMTALERRAQRLTALAKAQQQLALVTNADNLPVSIAEAVRSVFPFAVSDVFATSANELVRVLVMRNGLIVAHEPATDSELALARETLRTGVSRLAVQLTTDRHSKRGTAELCAVLRYGSRSTGVLRLVAETPDAFDLQDLDLLSILMRQAGAAVERSRAFTLKDFQRQRAEGAAELARVTLSAQNLGEGTTELLGVLDRFVPSIGKAIGVARQRDGQLEYVATSGTLDTLHGHRPVGALGLSILSINSGAVELPSLQHAAAPGIEPSLPDEWGFVVPLFARERMLGVLLVSAPRTAPLLRRDRVTLERLSTSLALALDALLLDEDEQLARQREQLLATALTTIDHPIFILDRVGVRFANPAAANEYGWSQADLIDKPFEHLVVGVEPRPEQRIGDDVAKSMRSVMHHVHRRRDGSEFPAAVTISPLRAQDGEPLGQVVSVRNITADRGLEEQLRQTEKMIALGELVAGVAHEINNPLTGVSAFAQLLLEEKLTEDQRESVRLIKQESDRATAVIRDLLVFARKSDPATAPVDLNDLLMQSLRLRAYPLRSAGITVAYESDPTMPLVHGNGQRLQQVLINLIGNAEHAMINAPTKQLTVRTDTIPGFVRVAIIDTGIGMSADIQRRIFEPFFTTKAAGVGTGLGLSVSYGIIKAHNGHIEVESEVNRGTKVTVVLPCENRTRPLADHAVAGVIAESTIEQESRQ